MENKKENNIQKSFIEKAAQQALSEALGFDEARVYYLFLTKKEKDIEKEFSYSKKYRLLKELFKLGAMGKIKPENQDFFSYILLPPSFLYEEKVDKGIIDYLEKIYKENYSSFLENNFSQLILKNEKGFILFLLKYFMKDQARVMSDYEDFNNQLGKQKDKVILIKTKETRRKIGVIDRRFAFDFVRILSQKSEEYIGYIARKTEKDEDYISLLEEEMKRVCVF